MPLLKSAACSPVLTIALAFVLLTGLPLAMTGSGDKAWASQPAPAVAAATAAAAAAETDLQGDTSKTRFVIGLERATDYQVFALAAPNRVIIEMPDVKVQLPQPPGSAPVGLVRSFRGGLSAPGRMRIVIDVTGPVVVEKATIEKPRDGMKMARLTIDIAAAPSGHKNPSAKRPLKPTYGLGAVGLQPPSPRPAVKPSDRANDRFRQTIVIDPGHGGHDSGAVKNGTIEKEVVLAFSQKLRDKLHATGRYRVIMTRDSDRFVELDERRAFADRSGAALFIAVHADYAGSKASGATIYSLRDTMARDLMRSARGEVKANVLSAREQQTIERVAPAETSAIKAILADLAVREVDKSQHLTKEFADAVVSTMGESTTMMSNPDREANFRVLKSVKMPSVLIELAYVSNRADAANLKSDAWRDRVASSIQRAVDNYFSAHVARLVQ